MCGIAQLDLQARLRGLPVPRTSQPLEGGVVNEARDFVLLRRNCNLPRHSRPSTRVQTLFASFLHAVHAPAEHAWTGRQPQLASVPPPEASASRHARQRASAAAARHWRSTTWAGCHHRVRRRRWVPRCWADKRPIRPPSTAQLDGGIPPFCVRCNAYATLDRATQCWRLWR